MEVIAGLIMLGVIVALGLRRLSTESDVPAQPWTLDHINCGIGMVASAVTMSLVLMWIAGMP